MQVLVVDESFLKSVAERFSCVVVSKWLVCGKNDINLRRQVMMEQKDGGRVTQGVRECSDA